MKKQLLYLCAILLSSFAVNSQIFINKVWEQVNGTTDTISLGPLALNTNGNIIASGNEKISGQMTNFRTSCLTPGGACTWTNSFNNTPNNNDFATAITRDNAGNIYVAGSSYSSPSNNLDITIIKYNSLGVQQFIQYYNGPGNNYDVASGIVVDNSGNIFVTGASVGTGFSLLDFVTLKLNSSGVIQWVSRYNFGNGIDIPSGISLDNSGNPIVSGSSSSSIMNNNWDFASVKYNSSNGAQLAAHRQVNVGNAQDKLIAQTKDAAGNIYVTGATSSTGTNFNIQTIKYNSSMVVQWIQTYDGYGMDDFGNTIALDNSGNVIVGGYSDKPGSQKEMVLLKYSNNGSLIWSKTKQPEISTGRAEILKIIVDPSNDIYVGGHYTLSNQDIAILKYNSNGEIRFEKTYNGIGNNTDQFMDLLVNGNFFTVSGRTTNGSVESNIVVHYETRDITPTPVGSNMFHSDNIVIAEFNKAVLKMNKINDKEITFGVLSDFVADSTCQKIDSLLLSLDPTGVGGEVNSAMFPVNKIVPWLAEADSLSQSRMGDYVKLPKCYAFLAINIPPSFNTQVVADTLKTIKPDIYSSQMDLMYPLNDVPNDLYYFFYQAGLHPTGTWPNAHINMETAWDLEAGEPFVRVGVYDTGIDGSHYDLTGTVGGGFDYVANSSATNVDNNGHGTSCGGIIGAKRHNGPGINSGIAGIAGGNDSLGQPGVKLYTMRIANTGFGDFVNSQKMFNAYVQGATSVGAGGYGLHVMSNSYGQIYGPYDGLAILGINTANRNGVAFVASRGNNADNEPNTPGTFKEQTIMCVGGSGNDGHRAMNSFNGDANFKSMWGYPMDFLAPGVTTVVATTAPSNQIIQFNGTSASAPHVAGVSALMMSYYNQPTANWDNIVHEDCEAIMKRTCTDLTITANPYNEGTGYDQYTGHGRINAGLALKSIEKPQYRIRHIDQSHYATSSSKQVNNPVNGFIFWPSLTNLAAGYYYTSVYEIITTINYNVGANEQVVSGWPLYKASTGWPNYGSIATDEPWYVELLSYNSNQAVLRTYSYWIQYNLAAQTINQYHPMPPNNVNSAFSLYTFDPTVIGVKENNKSTSNFIVFPNPSQGLFTLMIESSQQDKLNLSVIDIMGRNIKSEFDLPIKTGQNFIPLNLEGFGSGMYFVNISSDKNISLTQKIIIK